MLTAGWLRQLQQILLCGLAFTIPFPFIYSSVALVALVLVWLLQVKPPELWANIRQRHAIWPWLLYVVLLGASYFYSSNKQSAAFDLQVKLGMLLLPLIITCGNAIPKNWIDRIYMSFIAGITSVSLVCISYAIYAWNTTGRTNVFFYEELVTPVRDIHAVYMAWYTLFSLSILLFYAWKNTSKTERIGRFMLIILHIIFFILLSSKTLILLFFVLVAPLYLRKNIKHLRLAAWKVIVLVTVVTGMFLALVISDNPVKQRYEDVILRNDLHLAWLKDYSQVDESQLSNLTIRVMAWRMGIENVIEKNLWLTGCGNGDAQDLQNAKMASYHMQNWDRQIFDHTSALYNVNLHNMALQSLVMIGLPGFMLFLVIIFSPLLRLKYTVQRSMFFMFHLSAIAFMMQESSLQTQAGVLYYSFFVHIFWNIYYNVNSVKNIQVKIPESEKK